MIHILKVHLSQANVKLSKENYATCIVYVNSGLKLETMECLFDKLWIRPRDHTCNITSSFCITSVSFLYYIFIHVFMHLYINILNVKVKIESPVVLILICNLKLAKYVKILKHLYNIIFFQGQYISDKNKRIIENMLMLNVTVP